MGITNYFLDRAKDREDKKEEIRSKEDFFLVMPKTNWIQLKLPLGLVPIFIDDIDDKKDD